MSTLKRILIQMAIGANLMAAVLLWACGLSSMLNPAGHPYAALFGLGFPLLLLLNLAFVLFWIVFCIRYVWLPFVGMLFSVFYIYDYCPLNWPRKKPADALMLMTYNTEFLGNGVTDAEGHFPLLNYIAHSGADIICLQEGVAAKTPTAEYADSVMKAAGYHIRRLHDGKSEPQLIYSRLPIVSAHRIAYESQTNGSMAAELLYEGDTILLVNNHLESYKLTPTDKMKYKEIIKDPENGQVETNSKDLVHKMAGASRLRGPQVDSVLNYIEKSGRKAVIACGDFNDSPISYSCRRMSSRLTSAFCQSGNGLGLSYNQKGFYFRIDHIFISDYWQSYETHVDKTILWSDHYPMITYLKKRKKGK
ncbi:MAG: endonuclease/exonuclease/phosphatase family protein [Paraprevotella sp.]|nr:endonuclease/exonuclease/phosphatase family protein [Paraprevotella sp.]